MNFQNETSLQTEYLHKAQEIQISTHRFKWPQSTAVIDSGSPEIAASQTTTNIHIEKGIKYN